MSRVREVGFTLVRRAVPRTVENLERMPAVAAAAADSNRRVGELADTVARLEAMVARQRDRIAELERSRDETERFGLRIAELTDSVAQRLGGPNG